MRCLLSRPGIVSALGKGVDETARGLFAGDVSGMKPATLPGGDVTMFGETGLKGIAAIVDEAMEQLRPELENLGVRPERLGAVIGTSNSTMEEFTSNPDRIDMAFPAERLKTKWGVRGPAWSVSTACSSSAKVFASARRLLAEGVCDAVLAGGADAKTRIVCGGFNALEALSPRLARPLCADRDGINLGEGAAIFIMRRGGEAEGIELLGVGESSDAHHLTAPDPTGAGAEAAMRAALEDAGLEPHDIGYINLHGTGTAYNDAMECAAVRRVFGDSVPCSSTKPMTGHCLGAAGAIEAALAWIALSSGSGLPPHAASPVDRSLAPFPVPGPGNSLEADAILSNSFAFGGSNASVILGRTACGRMR
ncbi:MAG: hypothetical protein K6F50_05745 [Kiritimatiellae bacterium]|nr:hypothetical protein [Kiritimatiellia bacterium]